MSIWFAYSVLAVFLLYLQTITFFERIVYVPFVGRHIKGLWNIAGLLFFIFVGVSVIGAFTN